MLHNPAATLPGQSASQCCELTLEQWNPSSWAGEVRSRVGFYLLGPGARPTTPKRGKGTEDELTTARQQWGPLMGPQMASVSSTLPWPLQASSLIWEKCVLSNQLNILVGHGMPDRINLSLSPPLSSWSLRSSAQH